MIHLPQFWGVNILNKYVKPATYRWTPGIHKSNIQSRFLGFFFGGEAMESFEATEDALKFRQALEDPILVWRVTTLA